MTYKEEVLAKPAEAFMASGSVLLPGQGVGLHKAGGQSSIGHAIRILRKEKGLSQEELAARAGINRTTIARVECGIFKTLSVEKLGLVAQAIGADLKTILIKAESLKESFNYRSHLSRIEFSLDYPQDGFRIFSYIPRRKEFFFGKIEIQMQKTIPTEKLPHPDQIYLHCLEGKVMLTHESKEYLLRPSDCFIFSGSSGYEFYNPDAFKVSSAIFITYPSFVV